MAERKKRVKRNGHKQGTDNYEFEVAFQSNLKDLPEQPLINDQGKRYGTVKVVNGKATVNLVLPEFVRDNNIQPFTLTDSIYLEICKNDVEKQLKQILGSEITSTVKSIECNITQKVSGKASQSDVLNLLCHATLSTDSDNHKWVGASKNSKYKEVTRTITHTRQHYYVLKAYDKTREQETRNKKENKHNESVPKGLLRIEIIMQDRIIKKLFGDKTSFSDILTKDSLIAIIQEYKRIFCDELIEHDVKTYLSGCKWKLIESLTQTDNVAETIAKERELIPDVEVLKKAMSKYLKLRHKPTSNLSRDIKAYAERYALPQDTILTLHDFKESCG
ncbi:hypothetical protein ACTQ5P_09700 [Bacillota bacterium LCP21S3_G6]